MTPATEHRKLAAIMFTNTVFLQGGQYSVDVPTLGKQQCFRLR